MTEINNNDWVCKANGKKFNDGKRYKKVTTEYKGTCWFADGGIFAKTYTLKKVNLPIFNDIAIDIKKMVAERRKLTSNLDSELLDIHLSGYEQGIKDLLTFLNEKKQ